MNSENALLRARTHFQNTNYNTSTTSAPLFNIITLRSETVSVDCRVVSSAIDGGDPILFYILFFVDPLFVVPLVSNVVILFVATETITYFVRNRGTPPIGVTTTDRNETRYNGSQCVL